MLGWVRTEAAKTILNVIYWAVESVRQSLASSSVNILSGMTAFACRQRLTWAVSFDIFWPGTRRKLMSKM